MNRTLTQRETESFPHQYLPILTFVNIAYIKKDDARVIWL